MNIPHVTQLNFLISLLTLWESSMYLPLEVMLVSLHLLLLKPSIQGLALLGLVGEGMFIHILWVKTHLIWVLVRGLQHLKGWVWSGLVILSLLNEARSTMALAPWGISLWPGPVWG